MDNVFTARDKKVHRSKRKMVDAALTERATRPFEPLLAEQVDVFLKQILECSKSQPVNMSYRIKHPALGKYYGEA